MKHPILLAAVVGVAATLAGGCGGGGGGSDTSKSAASGTTQTINVEMVDIGFKPDRVEVKANETVRFVFRNDGKIAHDAFVGDEGAQMDHEKEMREASGDMGHDAGSGKAITVPPGTSGTLTHTFKSGEKDVLIGCHQPGHYQAGMKIAVSMM